MDVKSYCDTMGNQLIKWKAGIYDVIRGLERLPADEKSALAGSLTQLNVLTDELDAGLARLAAECPLDWTTERENIDDKLEKMRETLSGLSEKVGLPDSLAWL